MLPSPRYTGFVINVRFWATQKVGTDGSLNFAPNSIYIQTSKTNLSKLPLRIDFKL